MPSSSSYTPGLLTWPDMPKSFGPGEDLVPMVLNHSGPFSRIGGMQQSVSTLLMTGGRANAPAMAGNGGLFRRQPRLPFGAPRSPGPFPQMFGPAPRGAEASRFFFGPTMAFLP